MVASCTHHARNFIVLHPEDHQTIVYIYRPASLSNAVISPMLLINGDKTINIKQDSYIHFKLSPGVYNFELELGQRFDGDHSIKLTLAPGQTYFLGIDTQLKFKKNDFILSPF